MNCQRHLFEIPTNVHYLNCAYMAPVSNSVAAAARHAVDRLRVPSRLSAEDFFEPSDEVRRLFARLINLDDPSRVAIVPSVSYAMATVARNTPLNEHGNVVVLHEQFPSAVYTWKRACDTAGATLRTVRGPSAIDDRAPGWSQAIENAIDDRTVAVVVPELHWTDGTRFDLGRIGRRARACGAKLIVDGTQSVGAVPFDVTDVRPDALVCAGYKWLMGPYAIGLAYYGSAYDEGVPIEENWITRRDSENFSTLVQHSASYQPGAIRYDVGERSNFVLLPMLAAGLSQVVEWGPSAIQQYCAALTAPAVGALRRLGYDVASDAHRAAHLFGIRPTASLNAQRMARTLASHDVSASVRGAAIRVAPHVYNDEADMTALVDALRTLVESN